MQRHAFVIPAYKDSPYLEECIMSLKKQMHPSEIIVTTSTPSFYIENLTKKHDLPYHINQNTPSIAGDWNFALNITDAELVTIAHQDDIYEEEFSLRVVTAMRSDKNSIIAFTDYVETIDEVKTPFSLNLIIKRILLAPFYISSNIKSLFVKKSILSIGNPICCPSVTFNNELLSDFKFNANYSCALDWQAWLDIAEKDGSFIYIKKKLLQHRIHKSSETTNQIFNGKRLKEEQEILQRIWGKKFGTFISNIYKLGQKGNIIKE